MAIRLYAGTKVEVDEQGFLVDEAQWVPDLAEATARDAGLDRLTEKHWRIITCYREEAARLGKPPDFAQIAELAGLSHEGMARLVRPDPERLAVRLAGLVMSSGASNRTSKTAGAPQEE
jgi:tRNA 2-thiouridine synthesizing protein E